MSDRRERGCQRCGTLLHHEDDCPVVDAPPRPVRATAERIARLVEQKSAAYGDAVGATDAALRALWPNGIPPERYRDAALIVRCWDKFKRIANRKDAFGESPWDDVAGYALRGAAMDEGGPADG